VGSSPTTRIFLGSFLEIVMLSDLFVFWEDLKRDPGVQEAKSGCLTAIMLAVLIAGFVHLILYFTK